MSDPKVSIVILHLDNREALEGCLRSCRAIRYHNHEVIVVQNGSRVPLDPGDVDCLVGRRASVVKSPFNAGYAGGNNLGIRVALAQGAEYVLLMNDDTEVDPGFLDALVQAVERLPRIGAVGPKIYYFDQPTRLWFAGGGFDPRTCQVVAPRADELDDGAETALTPTDWLTGCCLLMTRQALERAGLLDERFFLYWEDVDWCLRLRASGLQSVVEPSARIWHKISLSAGGTDSSLKAYHKTRSHLLLAHLHAPRSFPTLLEGLLRDIAWLLVKSSDRERFRKVRAYVAAVKDYARGRTGRGPEWLWQDG